MEKYLKNKNILVTGGSKGIGRSIVNFLLENSARVAIHYNRNGASLEKTIKKYPDVAFPFQFDLENIKTIPAFMEMVIQKMGHLDVLVNNAGIAVSSDITGPDEDWINTWNKTMDVNLNATGFLCKKAIQHFLGREKGGKIINVSSRAAFRGDTEDYMDYAASKAGMVALTRSIARAFGKKGIVAFTIAPGFVQTEMAQQFFDQYGKETALNQIALENLTKPEDVAPFVGFLASGLADHATGGTFDINAGSYVH
ncbi:MAG: SDR family oxidoreductase [Flavobacteriaceae bacterium]|nr:MAG: SDR family oxidoreductase [Flavobacteriaceae bacterium]